MEGSRAKTYRRPARAPASPAIGPDYGPNSRASSASCAPARSSSRTCGPSLLAGWTELSPTSTGSGIEWRAASSQPETSARRTAASGSSCWPTPVTTDAKGAARGTTTTGVMHPGKTLTDAIREWPTPTASEYGSSNNGCPGDGREVYATAGKASLYTEARREGGHPQPGMGRGAHGVSAWLDRWPARPGDAPAVWEPPRATTVSQPTAARRLHALGNAVVPQVAEVVGRRVVELLGAR